ncbi:MAG: type IV pilus twitching motility protein PilT [Deltaproteobacteria bacterium]|nr:type IV pilus twitching motility protein PilT [Deltaproteobacteria bacterium]
MPRHMNELFDQMLEMKASDLHLKSTKVPMIRVHGDMDKMAGRPPIPAEDLYSLLTAIMPERNKKQYEEVRDTDFAYELPNGTRMRCNVFKDIVGVGAVFRQIPSKILTTKDLGVPPPVVKLCDYPKGLVLVTGPTGSGKSTTLAALIDHINGHEASHIITIEDPVEFVHPDKMSLINQRELGVSTMSFKAALRAALREDPDVVLVGELRDLETTEIAIETAETGHLVFATLHTNTAAATVDRIINQFPADRQEQIRLMLSTSLLGVVSQTLCKKVGGGRVAALEVLIGTPAIANLIREGKTFQIPSAMQTGKSVGMQTLCDALCDLVKSKQIEAEEAYRCAVDKKEMSGALTRMGLRGTWGQDVQAAG